MIALLMKSLYFDSGGCCFETESCMGCDHCGVSDLPGGSLFCKAAGRIWQHAVICPACGVPSWLCADPAGGCARGPDAGKQSGHKKCMDPYRQVYMAAYPSHGEVVFLPDRCYCYYFVVCGSGAGQRGSRSNYDCMHGCWYGGDMAVFIPCILRKN